MRKQYWAGELRQIGRRGYTEEVPVGEDPCLQKAFHFISLSLLVDGTEDYKIFVQALGADSPLARSITWSSRFR